MEKYDELADRLEALVDEDKRIIEVAPGVKGISNGSEILITACHHANELYATFGTVLDYARNMDENVTAVPVVDVQRFNDYMRHEKRLLPIGENIAWDMVAGYKGNRLSVKQWDYGTPIADETTKGIEEAVKKSGLVIDIHNSALSSFFFITHEMQDGDFFLSRFIKEAERNVPIYESFLSKHPKMMKGLYATDNNDTIAGFAAKNGSMNLVIEVPIYSGRNEQDLQDMTAQLISKAVQTYRQGKC